MKKTVLCFLLIVVFTLVCSSITYCSDQSVKGVWVSTVYSLDYPNSPTTSTAALKSQADEILDGCASMGLNTVFLQVRPAADALYDSDIFPWSKYLTGTQGVAPKDGFDPLAYWIAGAHSRGLELHAWLNPYRVATNQADYEKLADSNPAKVHSDWVYSHNGQYYFDAGKAAVRQLVTDGVKEILNNYDVDGIHLDDYFYPGDGNYDDKTFANENRGFTNKGDWRRDNNDQLIQMLAAETRAKGKTFGVSPAGIWANKSSIATGSDTKGNQTYFSAYADTRKWVIEGWLDYICPQIYWEIGYAIADYQTLAYWWADVVKASKANVDLYIGMADYRYFSSGSAKWTNVNTMQQQMALNDKISEIKGEVHFRYDSIVDQTVLNDLYTSVYRYGEAPLPQLVAPTSQHKAYLHGDNGAFRPEDGLTRGEIATIFSLLIVDSSGKQLYNPNATYTDKFTDVHGQGWYANYIGFMVQRGLLSGYGDGTFRPNAKITRAECASIVARFFLLDSTATNSFKDVEKSNWAYFAISNCNKNGYMVGSNGKFYPKDNIRRGEIASLVNRVLGRVPNQSYIDANPAINPYGDVQKGHWAYYDIVEASYSHDPH